MDLLKELGERVWMLRRQQGLTREQLAVQTGMSTRFLAEVEAGRGNISLTRLESLAAGLRVSLSALVGSLPSARLQHVSAQRHRLAQILNLLPELDDRRLEELNLWLQERSLGRDRMIALIGLRGAGKTTVGKKLAQKLRREFIELDELVEKAAGLTLQNIFEVHGEDYYRNLEHDVLLQVLSKPGSAVLACGGGIVMREETYQILRQHCYTFWLKAKPEDHWNRVLRQDPRPIRNYPDAFAHLQNLLLQRERLYTLADHVIDTSRLGVDGSVRAIVKKVPAHKPQSRKVANLG